MPYIARKRQAELLPFLQQLVNEIKRAGTSPGDVEYVLFTLLLKLSDGDNRRFANMNTLVGVLETTKAEFLRRVLGPYEDLKLTDNWAEGTPEE